MFINRFSVFMNRTNSGPGDMRHHHVKDRRGKIRIVLKRLVRFLSITRSDHVVTFLLEDRRDQSKNGRIVVGYQDSSFCSVIAQLDLVRYARLWRASSFSISEHA